LIANQAAYADPVKRHAMEQLHTLLAGTLEARGKVLLKLNVSNDDFEKVVALVPSMKTPTVSKLFRDQGYAIETVVPKRQINTLIPALKDAGATDILELPIEKIIH
jgi:ATP phosphoribosyltransferase